MLTARKAVNLITNRDTIAVSGFVGCGVAEEVMSALEERFLSSEGPRDLTIMYAAGQGDGDRRGPRRAVFEHQHQVSLGVFRGFRVGTSEVSGFFFF